MIILFNGFNWIYPSICHTTEMVSTLFECRFFRFLCVCVSCFLYYLAYFVSETHLLLLFLNFSIEYIRWNWELKVFATNLFHIALSCFTNNKFDKSNWKVSATVSSSNARSALLFFPTLCDVLCTRRIQLIRSVTFLRSDFRFQNSSRENKKEQSSLSAFFVYGMYIFVQFMSASNKCQFPLCITEQSGPIYLYHWINQYSLANKRRKLVWMHSQLQHLFIHFRGFSLWISYQFIIFFYE